MMMKESQFWTLPKNFGGKEAAKVSQTVTLKEVLPKRRVSLGNEVNL